MSVLVCSTLAWLLLGTPASGINDADIILVYAWNFLDGHGLAHTGGTGQAVGFPSLLWMVICSFFLMISRSVEVPLFLLNLIFGIITVYVCLKRCNQKPTFLVLLCAAPAWFAWCQLTLVESGLWCLLLTLAILAVSERRIFQSTILLPLLMLTRPEAMLWGWWLMVLLYAGLGLDRGWRVGLRLIFRPLFAFGTVWAALLLLRGHVFGTLLPGTLPSTSQSLQSSLRSGASDLLVYLFSNPVVLLVVLVFSWVCIREILRKQGLSRQLAVGCCLLPGLLIPLMVEDPRFRAFRFYLPIWPLLCLVSAWAMPLLYNRLNKPVRRLAPVALLAGGWLIFALSPNLRNEFSRARLSREQGAIMARMFEDHTRLPSIASGTVGGYRRTYAGEVYDLTGLTGMHMEYRPGAEGPIGSPFAVNHDAFHEWQPDILIDCESDRFDGSVLKELQSDSLFKQHYIKGELWYNDEILIAYFSRRFIEGLQDGHYAFQQDLQYALNMEDG